MSIRLQIGGGGVWVVCRKSVDGMATDIIAACDAYKFAQLDYTIVEQ